MQCILNPGVAIGVGPKSQLSLQMEAAFQCKPSINTSINAKFLGAIFYEIVNLQTQNQSNWGSILKTCDPLTACLFVSVHAVFHILQLNLTSQRAVRALGAST